MLKIGDKVPDFTSPDQNNNNYCLRNDREKWIVLYFANKVKKYVEHLKYSNFKENLPFFKENKITIVAVIPNSVQSISYFVEKNDLDIDIISDVDYVVARKYNVDYESKIPDYHKGRTIFIIDPDGIIRYIYKDEKVTGNLSDYINKVVKKLKQLIK
jgi:thioredoxin-dependent peroxiredoxin